MRNYGYIRIPRSISALPPSQRTLLEHICYEVRHSSAIDTEFGTVEVGQMLTSRATLMKSTGLTAQKIRTALDKLREGGYIEVEATARYTKITLTWQDFVSLCENNIMLNNQANNQANNQVTTSASVEDSARYSGQKSEVTKSVTKQITSILNNVYKEDNIHTQDSIYPVSTKSAPARESTPASAYANDARVAELYEWIIAKCPEFMRMTMPFTAGELKKMVDSYNVEDIQRILGSMQSKGYASKETNAYSVFENFAGCDFQLKARKQAQTVEQSEIWDVYTAAEIARSYGGDTDTYFTKVYDNRGKFLGLQSKNPSIRKPRR